MPAQPASSTELSVNGQQTARGASDLVHAMTFSVRTRRSPGASEQPVPVAPANRAVAGHHQSASAAGPRRSGPGNEYPFLPGIERSIGIVGNLCHMNVDARRGISPACRTAGRRKGRGFVVLRAQLSAGLAVGRS